MSRTPLRAQRILALRLARVDGVVPSGVVSCCASADDMTLLYLDVAGAEEGQRAFLCGSLGAACSYGNLADLCLDHNASLAAGLPCCFEGNSTSAFTLTHENCQHVNQASLHPGELLEPQGMYSEFFFTASFIAGTCAMLSLVMLEITALMMRKYHQRFRLQKHRSKEFEFRRIGDVAWERSEELAAVESDSALFLAQLRRSKQIIDVRTIRVIEEIGRGQFGTVYHAQSNQTDYAVKSLGSGAEGVELQLDEVIVARNIVHPNVVQFLGMAQGELQGTGSGPQVWLLLEFCGRGDLYTWLHNAARPLAPSTRLGLLHDVALGLLFVHDHHKMAHLDLKSQNILVSDATPPRAKIADFGLCAVEAPRASGVSTLEQPGAELELEPSTVLMLPLCSSDSATSSLRGDGDDDGGSMATTMDSAQGYRGTPEWMAPEMWTRGDLSKTVDVFSFAIVMWELLTRRRPYTGYGAAQHLSPADCIQLAPQWAASGERPAVPTSAPDGMEEAVMRKYVTLMCDCWKMEAGHRPTMTQVARRLALIRGAAVEEGDAGI